jgi:hypothetical protein
MFIFICMYVCIHTYIDSYIGKYCLKSTLLTPVWCENKKHSCPVFVLPWNHCPEINGLEAFPHQTNGFPLWIYSTIFNQSHDFPMICPSSQHFLTSFPFSLQFSLPFSLPFSHRFPPPWHISRAPQGLAAPPICSAPWRSCTKTSVASCSEATRGGTAAETLGRTPSLRSMRSWQDVTARNGLFSWANHG